MPKIQFSDHLIFYFFHYEEALRMILNSGTSSKNVFFSESVIFWGLRLSLGHFGQQAPESHVSQFQNGVSTSPLPPFIVDLLTY